MRYQVPQFIEVEDKIFGPLTLKQFIYLVGGGAIIFLLYIIFPFFIFVLLAIPVAALAAALAFYKINNKPFIVVLENAFSYFTKNKIYTWKKQPRTPKKEVIKKPETQPSQVQQVVAPKLTKEKLSDLAWSLDIKSDNKQEK